MFGRADFSGSLRVCGHGRFKEDDEREKFLYLHLQMMPNELSAVPRIAVESPLIWGGVLKVFKIT